MLNVSAVPLHLLTFNHSDNLLTPLWDHLLAHYRPYISSPLFLVVLAFSSYVFFSLPFAVMDLLGERVPSFYKYKIQPGRRPTVGMMARSFRTALFNHIFFVLPSTVVSIFILPLPEMPQEAPSLCEIFVDGLALLLVFDTQYYIWHVIHHKHVQLYRCIHAIHHEYVAPFSWSTEQLSIPELMTVGFWSNQDPILLKCHPLTTWCVTVLSIWMSVEDHIGYDLPWGLNRLVPFGILGGAPAHDVHHQKPNSNYAPFFSHWDRIFGTAVPLRKEKKH
ncbi:cholesterol 25-hydroxylase-like protein 1, member 1 [Stigmatopora argus]